MGDNQYSSYLDGDGQCQQCPPNAVFQFVVIGLLLLLGIPVVFWIAMILTDPDLVPIGSPLLSVTILMQFVCRFDEAIAGGMWPPLLQAVFDAFNPFLRLDVHTLNFECALGISIMPETMIAKFQLGTAANGYFALAAFMMVTFTWEYLRWLVRSVRQKRLLLAPWALPEYAPAPVGHVARADSHHPQLVGQYLDVQAHGHTELRLVPSALRLGL